ncbi:MAG: hypothetical protein AAF727_12375 [Pseudomonadota bacterium]
METEDSINARSARVQSALDGAFGVRAGSLERALRKTGRRMPKKLHVQAQRIVEAEEAGGNPKLLRQIDSVTLSQAEDMVVTWLDAIDRADRRRAFWTGIGAALGFNFLLIVGLVVLWMWWTGRV